MKLKFFIRSFFRVNLLSVARYVKFDNSRYFQLSLRCTHREQLTVKTLKKVFPWFKHIRSNENPVSSAGWLLETPTWSENQNEVN